MKRKKPLDITGEVCSLCCARKLDGRRGREYFRHGQSLVIIEDVPAWLCNKCGERYDHGRVYKRMRQIAANSDHLTEHVTIPVARYRGDEAA